MQSDILDGIGDFRDEDRIRSTGQTSMQSNPACVSTHDFYHHDAAMQQRGAVQSIDTLGGKTYGGVEAKRECGGFKIVVNGLGHSHNAETFFVQLIGDGEAVVSTDGNKSVDLVIAEPLKHLIGTVNLRFASVGMLDHATERIAAIGGTKNGAAEARNLADGRTMKFHQSTVGETFRLEESVVALANADDLPAPNLLAAYTAP